MVDYLYKIRLIFVSCKVMFYFRDYKCNIFDPSTFCVLPAMREQIGKVNGWQLAKMKKSIPDMSLP